MAGSDPGLEDSWGPAGRGGAGAEPRSAPLPHFLKGPGRGAVGEEAGHTLPGRVRAHSGDLGAEVWLAG